MMEKVKEHSRNISKLVEYSRKRWEIVMELNQSINNERNTTENPEQMPPLTNRTSTFANDSIDRSGKSNGQTTVKTDVNHPSIAQNKV